MSRTSRALALPIVLAAQAVLFSCSHPAAHEPAAKAQPIAIAATPAHKESIDLLYRASGTLRGRNTAYLTSRTVGYVRSVSVRAGDKVTVGQVLAVLEAKDVEASVRRARAQLAETMASVAGETSALKGAEADEMVARTSRDRAVALLAKGAITQSELDDAEARWRVANARLESARAKLRAVSAGVDAAQAGLAESQTMLGYAQLTAPFSGRVIERRVDPGSLASPGAVILVLEEDGPLRVEASVDESRGGAIVLGDVATIELEAPLGNVEGMVGEIVPNVDVASRAFLVKVDFKTPPPGLRPGMFARVAFRLGKRTPLVVPTSSLSAMGALDRVFVVDKDHAHLRIVTVGEPQGAWTEVLSGLDEGELVVTQKTVGLVDGAPVKVTP